MIVIIILYTNNCPKCKILKNKLDEKNIKYEICNDIDLMIEKGFKSVPMLKIEGQILNFNDSIIFLKEKI